MAKTLKKTKKQAANTLQALFETAQKKLGLSYHDMSFAVLAALMQRSLKHYSTSSVLFRYELGRMSESLEELGAAVTELTVEEAAELVAMRHAADELHRLQ